MPPFTFNNRDSYTSLTTRKGIVKMALRKSNESPESETVNSRPYDYFAHASKLAPMLTKGHLKLVQARPEKGRWVSILHHPSR